MDLFDLALYRALNKGGGGGDITVEPLSVDENGMYTAPAGKAYSPVNVEVSGGGGATVLSGSSMPTTDIGDDGDLYFQTPIASGVKNVSGQYINTGYSGNSNSKYVIEFMVDADQNSQYPTPFGARSTANAILNASALSLAVSGYSYLHSSAQWGSAETNIQSSGFPGANQIKGKFVRFEMSAGTVKMIVEDAEYTHTFNPTDITSTTPIGIFGYLVNGNLQGFSPMTGMILYRFSIYENNVLQHDFVAALDDNDVPCVYDNVTEQYVYHSGSGTLQYISGGEILHSYLKVNGAWQELIGSDISDVG